MSLDLNELMEESKRLSEGNNDFLSNFVKFPEGAGAVVVRILGPAAPNMFDRPKNPLYQYTRIHRVNGKSLHCLKTMDGRKWVGECPVCRYYNWLWQESEKGGISPEEAAKLQAQARAIKPIERYYYNVIVRKEVDEKTGDVKENVGPKILSVGKTLHQFIIDSILGNSEKDIDKLGDVTDIKTGRDFKIIKQIRQSGRDSFPNYDSSKFLEPSAVDPDLYKIWMGNMNDLVSLRTVKDEEDAKRELKIHLGVIPDTNAGGFDASEYQVSSKSSDDEPVVTTTKKVETPAPVVSETPAPVTSSNEDDGVVDEDFFNSLRSLSN
jgi:hypothetical protein